MAEQASGIGTLITLARFAAPRLWRHLTGANKDGVVEPFEGQFQALLQTTAGVHVAASAFRDVSVETHAWVDTGLDLDVGDEVSIFGQGALWMSRPLDIRMGAGTALWARIGEGSLFNLPAAASSLKAQQKGRLFIIAAPPGVWENPEGDLLDAAPVGGAEGRFDVGILKWRGGAADGLAQLQQEAPGDLKELLSFAANRAAEPATPPEGWRYLWHVGEGEIYRPIKSEGDSCIHCETHENVGILQIPAERPLTDTLKLNWDWIAHELPSSLPEDIEPTHDYLSIAVEFDNGLDLTYMWSSALPEDTIFQCPLAWWDERETHWVVRTKKDLGAWLSEERSIKQDYARAIGGEMPAKVVQVWLIANSIFQRGTGTCDYRAIRLVDGEEVLTVTSPDPQK